MSFDALPIIVVSAHTQTAADEFITELIEEDVTVEVRPPAHASPDRVWRLRNKYYTADVRVRGRGAGAAATSPPGLVCAHVTLLEESEVRGEGEGRRLDELAWLGGRPADVGVVACRARVLPARLQAQCATRRLAPVALLDAQEGVGAVRAALHAHVWPNMRRAPRPQQRSPDSSSDELEEAGVEAMERFAAALGALGPAAGAVRGLQGEERRAAAEHLVAAFAAALGQDVNL